MLGVGTNYKLKLYLSKKIFVQMLPEKKIYGTLRGFDQFLNLVLEDSFVLDKNTKKFIGTVLVRGDRIISLGNY
jgi:small nuclear ribonucleoprotein (snRNP)-like protein